jgi:hypothetical protein
LRVVEFQNVPNAANNNITFIRIDPEDLQETLGGILTVLMDLSWLSRFDDDYTRGSFKVRADKTVADIKTKFAAITDDSTVIIP